MRLRGSGGMRETVRDLLPMAVRLLLRRARNAAYRPWSALEHPRLALRAARAARHPLARPGEQPFQCNICGAFGSAPAALLGQREAATCAVCGSNLRHRALVAALQMRLLGGVRPLRTLSGYRHLAGLGMSDVPVYSRWLRRRCAYTNTFFHQRPHLDIQAPDPRFLGRHDFVICSDVMEHVAPPVARAFANLRALLKPSGVLVLTVPYAVDGPTREHFPELHRFRIEGHGAARRLHNRTRDGREQVFDGLCFHGGDGATLELRVFSLPDLRQLLHEAGFRDIQVHDQPLPQWGIVEAGPCSLPITAIAG